MSQVSASNTACTGRQFQFRIMKANVPIGFVVWYSHKWLVGDEGSKVVQVGRYGRTKLRLDGCEVCCQLR